MTKEKHLYTVKPEKGKVFQQYQMTFQGSNAKLFKQSACGLRTGVHVGKCKLIYWKAWTISELEIFEMNCQEDNNKIQVADTKGTEARTDITTANAGNNGEDTIFELTQEFTIF